MSYSRITVIVSIVKQKFSHDAIPTDKCKTLKEQHIDFIAITKFCG